MNDVEVHEVQLCGAGAALVAAGCAQEQRAALVRAAERDQEEPTWTGTWYYIQTVTDAPPTSSVMFIGQLVRAA